MGDDQGSKRRCVRITIKSPSAASASSSSSSSAPKEQGRRRAFEINDEIYAFDKDRWWEGVITKVLEDSRCTVYIKTSAQEFEFLQSDLLLRSNRKQIQPQNHQKDIDRHSMTGVDTVSRKRVRPPREKETSQKTTVWKATELQNRRGDSRKVMVTDRDPSSIGSGHNAFSRETANSAGIYKAGVSRDSMGKPEPLCLRVGASPADVPFYQPNEVDTGGGASVEDLGTQELFKVTKKVLVTSEKVKSLGKECTDAIEQQNEMTHVDVQEQNEITLHHCKEIRKENNKRASTENHYNEAREEHQAVLPSLVTDPTNNKVSVQHNESLPFVKNSVMWKEIESMEIFQQMPQQPHFRPLEQFIGIHREGMAIGHMITFANLVPKIGESQLNMPRSELEEMLKDLVDLETHGFNVGKLQARVVKLLGIKHKQEMLKSRSKEVEEKIDKLKRENGRFDVEIVEMEVSLRKHEETIHKLKEGQESFMIKREKNASDIIALQREMDVIKDKFMSAKHVKPQNQIITKNLLRNSLDRYLSQTRIFKNRTVFNKSTTFRITQSGH